MPFCKNCGANLPEGSTFCSSCGTPVENVNQYAQQNNYAQPDNYSQQYNYTQYQQPVYNAGGEYADPADVQNNKAMAVLAYIGILVLVPIFGAKNSKFARYHANQGLVLFITDIAYTIIIRIIQAILYAVLPWSAYVLVSVITTILSLASVFFLVCMILGIVNACKGRMKELPLIGKIKILK